MTICDEVQDAAQAPQLFIFPKQQAFRTFEPNVFLLIIKTNDSDRVGACYTRIDPKWPSVNGASNYRVLALGFRVESWGFKIDLNDHRVEP